jgi:serine/threonine protein kinase
MYVCVCACMCAACMRMDGWVYSCMHGRRQVATHVAAGLAYMHRHGMVHMDVKPSNLYLSMSGAIKLVSPACSDFGVRTREAT